MFSFITNSFKELSEILTNIEEKIGFRVFRKYILFLLLVVALINIKSITREAVEFITDIAEDLHIEKMKVRDEFMADLNPILVELRSETGADRVLYFEYHNSEQNFDKIPFKYFDLMAFNVKYGVPVVRNRAYKDVNATQFYTAYNDLSRGRIIMCNGPYDHAFRNKYQGIFDLFNQTDGSMKMAIAAVPGVKSPIGFIVLEWLEDGEEVNWNRVCEYIDDSLPRINALVVSAKL